MATKLTSTGVLYDDGTTVENYVTATRAIFGYGNYGGSLNVTNLVSNTSVVGSDVTGVGTARNSLAAASYSS